jgi:hypothetical protein
MLKQKYILLFAVVCIGAAALMLSSCADTPTEPEPDPTATAVPTAIPVPTNTPVPQNTPVPTSTPTSAPVVFQNFEEGNGSSTFFIDDTPSLSPGFTAAMVHDGARAMEISSEENGAVLVYPMTVGQPVNLTGLIKIYAWVYDTSQSASTIDLTIYDGATPATVNSSADGVNSNTCGAGPAPVWTLMSWPLDQFGVNRSSITHVKITIGYSGTSFVDGLYAQ